MTAPETQQHPPLEVEVNVPERFRGKVTIALLRRMGGVAEALVWAEEQAAAASTPESKPIRYGHGTEETPLSQDPDYVPEPVDPAVIAEAYRFHGMQQRADEHATHALSDAKLARLERIARQVHDRAA